MTTHVLNVRSRRVFESVFGTSNLSQPTPHATPATNFTAPGQAWGGLSPRVVNEKLQQPRFQSTSDHVEDQVIWDRAWHLVTHSLSFAPFKGGGSERQELRPTPEQQNEKLATALRQVLSPVTELPGARQTEDVIVWFIAQARQAFLQEVLPLIIKLKARFEGLELLERSIKVLDSAHSQFYHGLSFVAEAEAERDTGMSRRRLFDLFERDYGSVMVESVMYLLGSTLPLVLKQQAELSLDFPSLGERNRGPSFSISESHVAHLDKLLSLTKALREAHLAGEKFQVIFAEIMDDIMARWIYLSYKGVWNAEDADLSIQESLLPQYSRHNSSSICVLALCSWIEDVYTALIRKVFESLHIKKIITFKDVEKYKEVAISRLADLRINELFDIVSHNSIVTGALEDLRTAISTPHKRLQLTEVFANNLQRRLLHPGTSTLQILRTYISMIRSFHALDHSKVLLDRVAYPLQLYLFSRADTVRIIIEGLLSDTTQKSAISNDSVHDKLHELASILQNETAATNSNGEELDWHDLEWVPDPVDAGPGYRRSKSADVIGTMISVLGTQEVFIKEFQRIIAELLLQQREKRQQTFQREIAVLDLLKNRFGEAPLQACEVMLKDIQDSAILTHEIRATLQQKESASFWKPAPALASHLVDPALDTRILSRLFWPNTVVDEERFKIPETVRTSQRSYEAVYEEKKSRRKLTWLNVLGQAEVELELNDRTVKVECSTYVASIIYAFDGNGVTKTAEQLEEQLEMDEDLVSSAIQFWLSKRVLTESSPGTYTVLETLSTPRDASSSITSTTHPSIPSPSQPQAPRAKPKSDGLNGPNSIMYWNFVKGMLTNSKKEMPVMQIGMMLKMAIPGGFPYGNDELAEWLGGKVEAGELEMGGGGKFRLKR